MAAYYNEIDPFAAQWLRNLIAGGHIAFGVVDTRSIAEVQPDDLRRYTQCHFFAGIGGWSLALRLAGWSDDRPVWTGSCPCQPFSAAGKRGGGSDERHLWPHWFRLIRERRPATIFGEQVEAAVGWGWLDAVFADLEAEGYATGAAVLPACGVGAPHIRQRVWFVGHADGSGREARDAESVRTGTRSEHSPQSGSFAGELADAGGQSIRSGPGSDRGSSAGVCSEAEQRQWLWPDDGAMRATGLVADAEGSRRGVVDATNKRSALREINAFADAGTARAPAFWADLDWLPCTDGKARPVEPGTFPLVAGLSEGMVRSGNNGAPFDANACAEGRVGRLRGYGNSINIQAAKAFIEAAYGA